jgi:hypothetical protein
MMERLPEDSYRYGRIGAVPIKANEKSSPAHRIPPEATGEMGRPAVEADTRMRAFSLSPATGLAHRPQEV